ncbi:unnamed protein product [Trifolium pratense]|uniref:Uncharacterized protein n=1 Tax=Trifolium pratense TaxID=57577 RepID=A0ACB0JNA3_TRIPR|nr:unnamed protein product [Trifolium pratense]
MELEQELGEGIRGAIFVSSSIQDWQVFVVFDVESSVKLCSDCDTGKGFILYIKSIV